MPSNGPSNFNRVKQKLESCFYLQRLFLILGVLIKTFIIGFKQGILHSYVCEGTTNDVHLISDGR